MAFFPQHHYLSRRSESQGRERRYCSTPVQTLCQLSELRNNSCSIALSYYFTIFPSFVLLLKDSCLLHLVSWLLPALLFPFLAGALITNTTRRIGSGLELWHCHNVGGDETATVTDSARLHLALPRWALVLRVLLLIISPPPRPPTHRHKNLLNLHVNRCTRESTVCVRAEQ